MCRGWDSNPQPLRDMFLKHARIPVPPPRHWYYLFNGRQIYGTFTFAFTPFRNPMRRRIGRRLWRLISNGV